MSKSGFRGGHGECVGIGVGMGCDQKERIVRVGGFKRTGGHICLPDIQVLLLYMYRKGEGELKLNKST